MRGASGGDGQTSGAVEVADDCGDFEVEHPHKTSANTTACDAALHCRLVTQTLFAPSLISKHPP
jgi:hypothetical protein